MTLIEVITAIALITFALFSLLAELASDVKQQAVEKTQATALHIANGSLEAARGLTYSSLVGQAGTSTRTNTVKSTAYTITRSLQVCSPTDSPNTCTVPVSGAVSTVHALVSVTWTFAGKQRTVQIARNLSDTSMLTVTNTTSPLGSCGGAGTTLVSGHLLISPSSVTVSPAGQPSGAITLSLTETGLANATCVPLTWSDDNGAHQVSMTGSGGTFQVTIPASSITKTVSTTGGSLTFTATVPGTQAIPSVSLSIVGAPAFSGSCSVSVAGLGLNIISLAPLTRNSLLAAGLTCTTVNLAKTDTVTATYQSGTGTRTATLTSTNGTTWTGTIPAGTAMARTGTAEGFTFQLTRASDGATASQNLTATLT